MKKFKLPKAIVILGIKFNVKECKLDEGTYGECEGHERIIKIQQNLTAEQQQRTLIHESIHAALFIGGLNELLNDTKTELEEAVVICLENAFSEIMDLNKIRRD